MKLYQWMWNNYFSNGTTMEELLPLREREVLEKTEYGYLVEDRYGPGMNSCGELIFVPNKKVDSPDYRSWFTSPEAAYSIILPALERSLRYNQQTVEKLIATLTKMKDLL